MSNLPVFVISIPYRYKERFDYGTRTDGQPVYHGLAPMHKKEDENGWIILRYTYDEAGNLIKKDIVKEEPENVNWVNRANYTYD